MTISDKKKCVFFDRDGIVNVPPPPEMYYILSLEDFQIMPEFLDALRIASERGYLSVIVTNQRCVNRGLIPPEELTRIHDFLREAVRNAGLELTDIYVCPHGNDDECLCRKPQPGMLMAAARKYNIDLALSWMVGDSETDIQAGRAAGCKTVLVNNCTEGTKADFVLGKMEELPAFLEQHLL